METINVNDLISDIYINKRTRYELRFGNYLGYFFVTTTRSEENCVELLIKMAHDRPAKKRKYFKIIKIKDGDKKVLFKGSIKGLEY